MKSLINNFVLSSTPFKNKTEAEDKINKWWVSGKLEGYKTKLYKTVEVYDLKLKFVKRK